MAIIAPSYYKDTKVTKNYHFCSFFNYNLSFFNYFLEFWCKNTTFSPLRYRTLPHPTETYRILPHLTAFYRILPILTDWGAVCRRLDGKRTANERQTVGRGLTEPRGRGGPHRRAGGLHSAAAGSGGAPTRVSAEVEEEPAGAATSVGSGRVTKSPCALTCSTNWA